MTDPAYSVLVLGCGNIAGRFDERRPAEAPPLTHAGAFAKHGGFILSACLDPDSNRGSEFGRYWGVARIASNFDDLYARVGEFDVISICSPTSCHAAHLERAITLRPRLIFCEKPLTASASDSIRLVDACEARGIALVVNYTRRWDPSAVSISAELKAGHWGEIRSVVGYYNKGIFNNGGHMLDLLIRILGPLEVVAAIGRRVDFANEDPTVAALLQSVEGRVPVTLCPGDARDYAFFELEVLCGRGALRMGGGGMFWEVREAVPSAEFAGYRSLCKPIEMQGRYVEAMTNAAANIYNFLSRGEVLAVTGQDACQVQQLCSDIYSASVHAT